MSADPGPILRSDWRTPGPYPSEEIRVLRELSQVKNALEVTGAVIQRCVWPAR